MFDEEADTVSVDVGLDTQPLMIIDSKADPIRPSASFSVTFRPSDTLPSEVFRPSDTIPIEVIDFEETDLLELDPITARQARAATDANWPPAPKEPASRRYRHAGTYRAITAVSSLIKIS